MSERLKYDDKTQGYYFTNDENLSEEFDRFLVKFRGLRRDFAHVGDLIRAYHDIEFENTSTPDQSFGRWDEIEAIFSERITDLLSFFHDRLKVYLRDQGARYDLIDAVLASGAEKAAANDDLLLIVRRVEALSELLGTEDGKNLLAGTNRAISILAIEEKKGTAVAEAVDPALLSEKAEIRLFDAVNQAEKEAGEAIQNQDFSAAMRALAALRAPIDSFFEDVLVNVENDSLRANRLALLARIRQATGQVADFSKIAG